MENKDRPLVLVYHERERDSPVVRHGLINGDCGEVTKGQNFVILCEQNWDSDVSSNALRTMRNNQRNNPKLIPLTEDVVRLSKYLKEKSEECMSALENKSEVSEVWRALSKLTLTELVLFNRRRQGEMSKLLMEASRCLGETQAMCESQPYQQVCLCCSSRNFGQSNPGI